MGNDKSYEEIAGSRRIRALKHIHVQQVPAVVRNLSDNDARSLASKNIQRKGLYDDEKAENIRQITGHHRLWN
jgi:ParB family transcriptional regulator, chromosome partitioning protein